jgi:hypothetical protein
MRALTLWQPWAFAIACGLKDVENRPWNTTHRGPFLVHAGRELDHEAEGYVKRRCRRAGIEYPAEHVRGALVAQVALLDVVRDSDSEWAIEDEYHWLLAGAIMLDEPIPTAGRQGWWNYDGPLPSWLATRPPTREELRCERELES